MKNSAILFWSFVTNHRVNAILMFFFPRDLPKYIQDWVRFSLMARMFPYLFVNIAESCNESPLFRPIRHQFQTKRVLRAAKLSLFIDYLFMTFSQQRSFNDSLDLFQREIRQKIHGLREKQARQFSRERIVNKVEKWCWDSSSEFNFLVWSGKSEVDRYLENLNFLFFRFHEPFTASCSDWIAHFFLRETRV